jgi:hypothetical protein
MATNEDVLAAVEACTEQGAAAGFRTPAPVGAVEIDD